jgi:predicted ATPase
VLCKFADVHWIDPTSREVLDALIERIAALPVLVIVTYRPEFTPPWSSWPHATAITLTRLTSANAMAMVVAAGGEALPAPLREQIVDHADGVPLFIEELTRAALDGATAVPMTLRDSLAERLDRQPAAKRAAQLGAAIGRSFSHELVMAVANEPVANVDHNLNMLVASGLADRRGAAPEATYTFKHALV